MDPPKRIFFTTKKIKKIYPPPKKYHWTPSKKQRCWTASLKWQAKIRSKKTVVIVTVVIVTVVIVTVVIVTVVIVTIVIFAMFFC